MQRIEKILEKLSLEDLSLLADFLSQRILWAKYPAITKLELFLTENCNLRCDYCFVKGKNPKDMPWEVARMSVDLLFRESRDSKELSIIFFGGEPLLSWDVMRKVIEYSTNLANSMGKKMHYSITTNGVLLNEEVLIFSQRYRLMFLLSLDGDKETHDLHRHFPNGKGTFEIVASKIPLLKRYQGWLGTRMTVTPQTVDKLADNVKFLFEIGINQFIIGADEDIVWEKESLREYKRQMKSVAKFYIEMRRQGLPIRMTFFEEDLEQMSGKYRDLWSCEGGADKICISPDGSIYPCSRFICTDEKGTTYYKLGDVRQGIVEHKLRDDLLDQREMIRLKCMRCQYKDFCTGGCPAINLLHTGSLYEPWKTTCQFKRIHCDLLREMPELRKV